MYIVSRILPSEYQQPRSGTPFHTLVGRRPYSPLATPSSPVESHWHLAFFGIAHIHTADEIVSSVHVGYMLQDGQVNNSRRDERVGLVACPWIRESASKSYLSGGDADAAHKDFPSI